MTAATEFEQELAEVRAMPLVQGDRTHFGVPSERELKSQYESGDEFLFGEEDDQFVIWGDGDEILWARGESLVIAGTTGVGKTTITCQVALGLFGKIKTFLGYPITPLEEGKKVLYLAMDRPRQIKRALRRVFTEDDRELLAERLVIRKGPPEFDFADRPDTLVNMARQAGASVVIVDSLKDAVGNLDENKGGAGYNTARQMAIAAGIDLIELHHMVKRDAQGNRPKRLADLYGSTWIGAGAGSVFVIHGEAGEAEFDLIHLKQPAEVIGPLRIAHDHKAGITSLVDAAAVKERSAVIKALQTAVDADGKPSVMTKHAIYQATGISERKVQRHLDELLSDGLIEVAPGKTSGTSYKYIGLYNEIM